MQGLDSDSVVRYKSIFCSAQEIELVSVSQQKEQKSRYIAKVRCKLPTDVNETLHVWPHVLHKIRAQFKIQAENDELSPKKEQL